MWICKICGYEAEGDKPTECPVCGAGEDEFKEN